MSLSSEIKIIRQKSFMTQIEFANRLHVSYTTVNRWEAGKARPAISAMKELKALCMELEIEYAPVENAWISSKVKEVENNG